MFYPGAGRQDQADGSRDARRKRRSRAQRAVVMSTATENDGKKERLGEGIKRLIRG